MPPAAPAPCFSSTKINAAFISFHFGLSDQSALSFALVAECAVATLLLLSLIACVFVVVAAAHSLAVVMVSYIHIPSSHYLSSLSVPIVVFLSFPSCCFLSLIITVALTCRLSVALLHTRPTYRCSCLCLQLFPFLLSSCFSFVVASLHLCSRVALEFISPWLKLYLPFLADYLFCCSFSSLCSIWFRLILSCSRSCRRTVLTIPRYPWLHEFPWLLRNLSLCFPGGKHLVAPPFLFPLLFFMLRTLVVALACACFFRSMCYGSCCPTLGWFWLRR